MLTVTTPAQDRSLLTMAELRGAVGQPDTTQDGTLQALGDRIAAMIASHCSVPGDGLAPPTLRKETVRESFRLGCAVPKLILQRRPVVTIAEVTANGVTLDASGYEFKSGAGLLFRIQDDMACYWSGRVTVTYEAGWTTVPDDLKLAAAKLAKLFWTQSTRDPLIRRQEVPGVLNTEYWVGGFGDGSMPPDIAELIGAYRYRMA